MKLDGGLCRTMWRAGPSSRLRKAGSPGAAVTAFGTARNLRRDGQGNIDAQIEQHLHHAFSERVNSRGGRSAAVQRAMEKEVDGVDAGDVKALDLAGHQVCEVIS